MGRQKPDYVWYVLLITGGCVKWHLKFLLLCIICIVENSPLCNEKGHFPTKYTICIGCQ